MREDIRSWLWKNITNINPAELNDLEAPPILIRASNKLNAFLENTM